MPSFEVPLPQQANVAGSFLEGYQGGQNIRLNELKLAAAQQEMAQRQKEIELKYTTQGLAKAAALGDQNSLAQLSALAPESAKGIREHLTYKTQRGAQLLQGVLTAPKPARAGLYQQAIKSYESEFGQAPQIPAEYSPEAEQYLKALITQSRDVEKVAEEEFKRPLEQAKVQSEYVGQQKTKADIAKTAEETFVLKAQREAMQKAGFTSPEAFKKYQEKKAEATATREINLPKAEGEAKQALKLIDDVIKHPGLQSMVGAKNLASGAITAALPFTNRPIPGTQAANFKAKFDQLQGKNFLQAFEALKGGGQITEIEGQKATEAISDMNLAQTEEEFKKSAEVLRGVIQSGLKRAKGEKVEEVGNVPSRSIPQVGEVQSGYQFIGGNPADPNSWRKL